MSLKRGEGRSLSLTLRRASAQSASTSGYSRHQKKFPNGDTYTGGWRNGLPEGEGRYCWADASTYEGGWKVSACLNMQLLPRAHLIVLIAADACYPCRLVPQAPLHVAGRPNLVITLPG